LPSEQKTSVFACAAVPHVSMNTASVAAAIFFDIRNPQRRMRSFLVVMPAKAGIQYARLCNTS
jgi:hypothetical protein